MNDQFDLINQETETEGAETPSVTAPEKTTKEGPSPIPDPEGFKTEAVSRSPLSEAKAEPSFNENSQPAEGYLRFIEKKELISGANSMGLCFLAGHLFMLILNLVYSVAGGIIAASSETAAAIITDPVVIHVIEIVWSVLIFLVPYVMVAKLRGYKIGRLVRIGKPKKGDILPFTLIGMGYCALSNILISQASRFFSFFNDNYNFKPHENPTGLFGFLIAFISVVIVPGLLEEFAVRGVIMGMIRKHGEGFAIIVSALLFGLMHRNFTQIPFAFITGLGLGFIAVKTKTIWITALIHAINNFVSLISSYALKSFPETVVNLGYGLYLVAAMLCGVIGILLLAKRKDFFSFSPAEGLLSMKEKLKTVFFSSPAVLIYTIICLVEAISYFFR